jgi:hypothetical protein
MMMDVLVGLLVAVAFALAFAYVEGCARLVDDQAALREEP